MKILNYTLKGLLAVCAVAACQKKSFESDPGTPAQTTSPTVQQQVDGENVLVQLGIPGDDGVQYYEGQIKKDCGCGTQGRGYTFHDVNKKLGDLQVLQTQNGQLIVTDVYNRSYVYGRDNSGRYNIVRDHSQIDSYCKKNNIKITDYLSKFVSWGADWAKKTYDQIEIDTDDYEQSYCQSNKCNTGYKKQDTGCFYGTEGCYKKCYTACGVVHCTNNTTSDDYEYYDDVKKRLETNFNAEDFWKMQSMNSGG